MWRPPAANVGSCDLKDVWHLNRTFPLIYIQDINLICQAQYGVVHILRNNFPELTDGILRPEVATVGCGHRPQKP